MIVPFFKDAGKIYQLWLKIAKVNNHTIVGAGRIAQHFPPSDFSKRFAIHYQLLGIQHPSRIMAYLSIEMNDYNFGAIQFKVSYDLKRTYEKNLAAHIRDFEPKRYHTRQLPRVKPAVAEEIEEFLTLLLLSLN